MAQPTVQLPDPPDDWDIDPNSIPGLDQNPSGSPHADTTGGDSAQVGGSPDYILPDGSRLGTVIQQQRSALQNGMAQAQGDPQTTDGGLGNAFGQYIAAVQPHGPLDFKNRFKGQDDPTVLSNAGNFAYYALGSGIFPDAVLDAGATGYNLYKAVTGQKRDASSLFGPDTSAQSVRDQALAYGENLK
jgi:hypothetical protein